MVVADIPALALSVLSSNFLLPSVFGIYFLTVDTIILDENAILESYSIDLNRFGLRILMTISSWIVSGDTYIAFVKFT